MFYASFYKTRAPYDLLPSFLLLLSVAIVSLCIFKASTRSLCTERKGFMESMHVSMWSTEYMPSNPAVHHHYYLGSYAQYIVHAATYM